MDWFANNTYKLYSYNYYKVRLTKKKFRHRHGLDEEDASLSNSSMSPPNSKSSAKPNIFQRVFRLLGPGLITGASDDDPSGIATYSQAGAKFGLGMVWLVLFLYPMMLIIEEMCARIGLVTEKGLASAIKKKYSKNFVYATRHTPSHCQYNKHRSRYRCHVSIDQIGISKHSVHYCYFHFRWSYPSC